MKIEKLSVTELKSKLQNIWRKHEKMCRESMGECLYRLRKKMRAQGARNDKKTKPEGFGAWCEGNLGISRRTADRWADEWAIGEGLKKPSKKTPKTFGHLSKSDESNNADDDVVVTFQMTLSQDENKTWLSALRILGQAAQKIVFDAVVEAARVPKKPAASVKGERKLRVLDQQVNAKGAGQ